MCRLYFWCFMAVSIVFVSNKWFNFCEANAKINSYIFTFAYRFNNTICLAIDFFIFRNKHLSTIVLCIVQWNPASLLCKQKFYRSLIIFIEKTLLFIVRRSQLAKVSWNILNLIMQADIKNFEWNNFIISCDSLLVFYKILKLLSLLYAQWIFDFMSRFILSLYFWTSPIWLLFRIPIFAI